MKELCEQVYYFLYFIIDTDDQILHSWRKSPPTSKSAYPSQQDNPTFVQDQITHVPVAQEEQLNVMLRTPSENSSIEEPRHEESVEDTSLEINNNDEAEEDIPPPYPIGSLRMHM